GATHRTSECSTSARRTLTPFMTNDEWVKRYVTPHLERVGFGGRGCPSLLFEREKRLHARDRAYATSATSRTRTLPSNTDLQRARSIDSLRLPANSSRFP